VREGHLAISQAIPKDFSLGYLTGMNDLWKNKPVKQNLKVQ